MSSDLTSISTFGWYQGVTVTEELTPISTFGWFFTLAPTDDGDLITFMLCLQRILERDLEI